MGMGRNIVEDIEKYQLTLFEHAKRMQGDIMDASKQQRSWKDGITGRKSISRRRIL